jgi:outer membrane biosynthesis protein TonB
MPRKSHRIQRILFRLFFLSLAGWALNALRRDGARLDDDVESPCEPDFVRPEIGGRAKLEHWEDGRMSPRRRRAAMALTFSAIFFAGATLTAGAGDQAAKLLENADEQTALASESAAPTGDAASPSAEPEAAPAPEAVPEAAPEAQPDAAPEAAPAPESTPEAAPDEAQPETAGGSPEAVTEASSDEVEPARSSSRVNRPSAKRPRAQAEKQARPQRKPKVRPRATAEQEAAAHGGAAVIWLNRALPDPTPRARRLAPRFAARLVRISNQAKVDWALVLGVLRAEGHRGRVPASPALLRRVARGLHAAGANRDEWAAALAVTGNTDKADKAVALANYNRAVGRAALVRGLKAEKANLVERLLKDGRVELYAGGRDDLMFGRIDVRVVALVSYLAESFGQVTVTSLFSGHRLYARPGVVSAHVYGQAVDVAGLAGLSITGHQEPGGLTEQAVRSILLLPKELQPRQVISLLGLGGPSFPLANHHDHVHVGY